MKLRKGWRSEGIILWLRLHGHPSLTQFAEDNVGKAGKSDLSCLAQFSKTSAGRYKYCSISRIPILGKC